MEHEIATEVLLPVRRASRVNRTPLASGDRVTIRGGRVVYTIVRAPGDFIDPSIWAWKLASESSGRSFLVGDDKHLHPAKRPARSPAADSTLF